jgi:sodium/potassium-transporting ATPase subunit alpha
LSPKRPSGEAGGEASPEIPEPHRLALSELFRILETSEHGLSSSEARRRLSHFGTNELRVRARVPEVVKFLRQFRNFFAILLMVGGALALLAEQLDPGQGNLYIAYALFGVMLLNGVFTYVQEYQSERIVERFREMLPSMVSVLRDGAPHRIQARLVVPGDVMLLSEGDRISADGRLFEHHGLKVDLSSLTGESEPRLRHLECTHDDVLQSRNMTFSGTLVQSGRGKAVVYATGMQTQIGRIVELTKVTKEAVSPIRKELQRFVRIISAIAISLGVLFFVVSLLTGRGTIGSLVFAIGIIVANVPEGLLPTVTLALTLASKRMAAKNALVKNLESVETLGSTTTICTDKTGTLTQGRIHVTTLVIDGQECAAWNAQASERPSVPLALQVMVLCNNTTRTAEGLSGDPTEVALVVYAESLGARIELEAMPRVHEEPFDSATRRMITVHRMPAEGCQRALLKGAPEVVFAMCNRVTRNGVFIPFGEGERADASAAFERLARRGERVLALALRDVDVAEALPGEAPPEGFALVALLGMGDPPRPEVPDALAKCRAAGIRVSMITGDSPITAEAIAREIGLVADRAKIVLGEDLRAMRDDDLARVLDEPELVFARTSPTQKLRIVQALRARGEIVTVTGDGVNDAPALKHADMGVAMGVVGTDVAKEASNMVLMDDNFATIVSAVEEGRTIFENIKKFIAYVLTSNVPEILPFIAYAIFDIPLPLTVVLILAIDLGTDILPALGLGTEAPEFDVMKKPPRPRSERLLTREMLTVSYGIVGVVQAAAGFTTFFVILWEAGWQWGQELAGTDPLYRTATTGFFASIILCQIADVLICRTRRQSLLSIGWLSNRLVALGVVTEIGLLLLMSYVPALNAFFGTAPLAAWHYLPALPFALLILVGDEVRRVFVRRDSRFVRWLTW